jgi:hypothetical protein
MLIELTHPELNSAKLNIASDWIKAQIYQDKNNCLYWNVNISDQEIQIEYSPENINKPLLRIDGFLIDYWTAKIEHFPGRLKFHYNKDFVNNYHNNNLQDRLKSLGESPSELTVDRVVGRNFHPHLVSQITTTIDEKSNIN